MTWMLITAFYVSGLAYTNTANYDTVEQCLDAQAKYSDNLPDDREPIAYCVPVMNGNKTHTEDGE